MRIAGSCQLPDILRRRLHGPDHDYSIAPRGIGAIEFRLRPIEELSGVSADELVAQVNGMTGLDLELIGVSRQGEQGGAAYVRRPDGRTGVITYAERSVDRMRQTADVLDRAKAAGLPVPAMDFIGRLPDGRVAVLQEKLPGVHITRIDIPLLDALVEVNGRSIGLLTDRPDVPTPDLGLRPAGPDPRQAALRTYDDRTRSMLTRIFAVGRAVPEELPGHDLVHPDLARGNVLTEDGRITGLVDWSSGALRGHRAFALVSLRSDLEWRALFNSTEWVPDSVVHRLDDVLRSTVEPDVLNACWAHWTLHKAFAAIEAGAPGELELWLRLGEAWLP